MSIVPASGINRWPGLCHDSEGGGFGRPLELSSWRDCVTPTRREGLGSDYATLKTPDADRFELWIRDLWGQRLGTNAAVLPLLDFAEASAALSELCALFGVEQREAKPAPKVGERLELDPSVPALRQHGGLWDLLVPDSGQCQTLQGEVIRIAGRVGYEVYDNGGINWDRSFGALLDQYLIVVRSGLPMPPSSVARAEAAVASLKGRSMSHQAVDDITELAVEWVRLNPVLVEMDVPDVGR